MANDPELFPGIINYDEMEEEKTVSIDIETSERLPPDVFVETKLTPYSPTAEVEKAVWDFGEKVREAIAVNPADWPKGRTLVYEVEFTVVPKTLTAKFGQE